MLAYIQKGSIEPNFDHYNTFCPTLQPEFTENNAGQSGYSGKINLFQPNILLCDVLNVRA